MDCCSVRDLIIILFTPLLAGVIDPPFKPPLPPNLINNKNMIYICLKGLVTTANVI